MLIALLVPLTLALLLFLAALLKAAIASGARPDPRDDRAWRRRQFLRYLGHRLVRADHRLAEVPQARSRPADSADDAGRADAAVDAEGIIFLILLGVKVDPVLLVGCVWRC